METTTTPAATINAGEFVRRNSIIEVECTNALGHFGRFIVAEGFTYLGYGVGVYRLRHDGLGREATVAIESHRVKAMRMVIPMEGVC